MCMCVHACMGREEARTSEKTKGADQKKKKRKERKKEKQCAIKLNTH